MIIAIQEYSDVPIYVQIRNQIVLGISDGRLKPGHIDIPDGFAVLS